jgi:hypothetical protein
VSIGLLIVGVLFGLLGLPLLFGYIGGEFTMWTIQGAAMFQVIGSSVICLCGAYAFRRIE